VEVPLTAMAGRTKVTIRWKTEKNIGGKQGVWYTSGGMPFTFKNGQAKKTSGYFAGNSGAVVFTCVA